MFRLMALTPPPAVSSLRQVKPDLGTFGSAVRGSNVGGGCKTLSVTSVASPVRNPVSVWAYRLVWLLFMKLLIAFSNRRICEVKIRGSGQLSLKGWNASLMG